MDDPYKFKLKQNFQVVSILTENCLMVNSKRSSNTTVTARQGQAQLSLSTGHEVSLIVFSRLILGQNRQQIQDIDLTGLIMFWIRRGSWKVSENVTYSYFEYIFSYWKNHKMDYFQQNSKTKTRNVIRTSFLKSTFHDLSSVSLRGWIKFLSSSTSYASLTGSYR